MSLSEENNLTKNSRSNHWRDRFAASVGVSRERKTDIYLDLSESATLRDTSYWLQILFSSGIAILGMVLNSPAVVIGAMLISPLMGPILASGLALASGDVILGGRAAINLVLSCALAVGFAVLLVVLLPFKEVTGEIAAPTSPNTLELFIALFSGAIGAIAVSREVKGVATSIPGAAIAVALMPPLDTIGFGLGLAATGDAARGLPIARGGGLLILTNLVAIIFSAMLVFLALRVNTETATKRVREWRSRDDESRRTKYLIARFPGFDKLRTIGNLPGRFLLILVSLALISMPLYASFTQLKDESVNKQRQNRVEDAAGEIWRKNFAETPDGRQRGYVAAVETTEEAGKTSVQMSVLSSQPLPGDERARFSQTRAAQIDVKPENLDLQLVEIPTTSSELLARTRNEAQEKIRSEADKVFTEKQKSLAAEIRRHSLRGIKDYFKTFDLLPDDTEFVNFEVKLEGGDAPQVKIVYLGEREIDGNTQIAVADDVQAQLEDPAAKVRLERIAPLAANIEFTVNQANLSDAAISTLECIAQILERNPRLQIAVNAGRTEKENKETIEARTKSITEYLASKRQIASEKIIISPVDNLLRGTQIRFKVVDKNS